MEEKTISDGYNDKSKCFECVHFYFNNGERDTSGCRAFPDEIPNIVMGGYNHDVALDGQVGDYVYQKATYDELCPFAQYLESLRKL